MAFYITIAKRISRAIKGILSGCSFQLQPFLQTQVIVRVGAQVFRLITNCFFLFA